MDIEVLRKIHFPAPEELDWMDWPNGPTLTKLPPDMEWWFAEDMVQLGIIRTCGDSKTFLTTHKNCIGLFQFILFRLFPGANTWYDLGNSIGATDYFWYSMSVECGYQYIEQLPKWCQRIWAVLVDEKIIKFANDLETGTTYFYIESFNALPTLSLNKAYQQLLPILIEEMITYQSGEATTAEIDELTQEINHTFNKLITSLPLE